MSQIESEKLNRIRNGGQCKNANADDCACIGEITLHYTASWYVIGACINCDFSVGSNSIDVGVDVECRSVSGQDSM